MDTASTKLGVISSFGERCGVAEYTRGLCRGLRKRNIDVKVCANYPKDNLYPTDEYVQRFFHTPFMTNQITADVDGAVEYLKDRNVIHVQFETSLYHPSWFPQLIQKLRNLHIPVVFTMHSSGIWPDFNLSLINRFITHEQMWCTFSPENIIPMGVKFRNSKPPDSYQTVTSFGLGRNIDTWVTEKLSNDVTYKTNYGSSKWLEEWELAEKLQESWVICLLYPPVGANVSSSAITFAMGLDRPILITDTNWFNNVINYSGLYICNNADDVSRYISYLTDKNNLPDIELQLRCRRNELEADGRTFDNFIERHINVYKEEII